MTKTILVTGATGKVGRVFINRLLADSKFDSFSVRALVSALLLAIDHPQARQQLFNACMDEPVDYGVMGKYLNASRGLPSVEIKTPYHSTWLDNTKAKLLLDWRPEYDMQKMVNSAFDYVRAETDPRKVWYPG